MAGKNARLFPVMIASLEKVACSPLLSRHSDPACAYAQSKMTVNSPALTPNRTTIVIKGAKRGGK
jgi:hypothetical protein